MNEVTFETTAERQQIEKQEAERVAQAEDIRKRDEQLSRLNVENAKQYRIAADKQYRTAEENRLAAEGRERQAQLAGARQRCESLRFQIEGAEELKTIEREIEAGKGALLSVPLNEAPPSAVQRLAGLQALVALWPARKAHLQEQLAQSEAYAKGLETTLDTIKRQFAEASAKLKEILKTAPTPAAKSFGD